MLLSLNGSVVEGRTATSDDLVFTVSVNNSGVITLDQIRALQHPDDSDANDSVSLASANLISLTATITDNDGDSSSAALDIGSALSFADDGPTISSDASSIPALAVDESDLATNASADFSGNFTAAFGADAAGSIAYSLGINPGASGLLDNATGEDVVDPKSGVYVKSVTPSGR